MSLLDKYKNFASEEVIVRDLLISYIQQKYDVNCPRDAFRYRDGVLVVRTIPLLKQQLLQQKNAIQALLRNNGIELQQIL